jgi:hypothetical protein
LEVTKRQIAGILLIKLQYRKMVDVPDSILSDMGLGGWEAALGASHSFDLEK